MIPEKIKPPHYYSGHRALWGPWRKLTPGRMCHRVGFRWYRSGLTLTGHPTIMFKT